jgi:outer membrane receptor protein involved in Fe transport
MFRQCCLRRLIFIVIFMMLAVAPGAWASTVGNISGVVKNKATNQPLTGANITILGTNLGATALVDGRYSIYNVPAGTYRIQVSLIGFKPIILEGVRVPPDFTTEVNFDMEQTVLEVGQGIEIRAEKPLVQKDVTGTTRFIDRQDIQNLPTRGYQDAAALQTGVVAQTTTPVGAEASNSPRLYIRGGRADEVAYFVDGFSQRDPLTGLSTTSINQNAIDQIVVMTGGFNAEYGKIMSGAVNVITREGGPRFFGSVEAFTDNLAGDWIGANKYDNNTYDVSLGGPLVPHSDKVTFFVSGERRWNRDRSPRPVDQLGLTSAQEALFPGGITPSNSLSGNTYQGKVTWKVNNQVRLNAGALGSIDHWQEYRNEYLFDAAHMPRYEDTNRSMFGQATYTPTAKTFVTLAANYFYTQRYRGDGVFFKDLYAYGQPNGNPSYPENMPIFYYGPNDTTANGTPTGAHVWRDYLHRESSYIGGKGDISFQWNDANQSKGGLEYRYHTLRRYRHLFPDQVFRGVEGGGFVDVDRFGYDLTDPNKHLDGGLDGAKHPKDFSVYLQDKYEKNQLVLNAGLRYDYMNPESQLLKDEFAPLSYGYPLSDSSLTPSKANNKLSPRLGIGFPVSERTQFHANYGIFYQLPNLEDLYVGYNYLGYKVFTGGYYYPFGNPALVPETTTAYEIGITNQLAGNSVLNATAFYKNVRNLVEVQSVRAAPNSYSTFENIDYGTIKGLDFAFNLRRTSNIEANLAYTLSWANGTGSVSNTQRNIAWTGGIPPKQTAPLDFDQRHKISVNLDWRLGKNMGPVLFGGKPLQKTGVNLLLNLASGTPYTPTKSYDEVTLAAVTIQPTGPINSRNGPWTYRVDLKADRGFDVGGLNWDAYIWVLNVLNRKNPIAVYTSSGDPEQTGWLSNPASTYTSAEAVDRYNLAQKDPRNYDIPRMVRFGLRTSF